MGVMTITCMHVCIHLYLQRTRPVWSACSGIMTVVKKSIYCDKHCDESHVKEDKLWEQIRDKFVFEIET